MTRKPRPPKGAFKVALVNFKIAVPPSLKQSLVLRAAWGKCSVQALVRRYLQEGLHNDSDK